jgi:hypothetical protein
MHIVGEDHITGSTELRQIAMELASSRFEYRRVGYDMRYMTFSENGRISEGAAECETFWHLSSEKGIVSLDICGVHRDLTCRLYRRSDRDWSGRWERFEQMNIELRQTLKMEIVMVSCVQRDSIRKATLEMLAATDWGKSRVHVQMDEGLYDTPEERHPHTGYKALEASLQLNLDYVLLIEDDLLFNRHLRYNLNHWPPLMRKDVTVASLYNPNIRALQRFPQEWCFIADPRAIYGSQAFILSRSAAEFCLEHWSEMNGFMSDIRIGRLADRMRNPMFYHIPSLVQHVNVESTWGGKNHQAIDFDPHWKASYRNRLEPHCG